MVRFYYSTFLEFIIASFDIDNHRHILISPSDFSLTEFFEVLSSVEGYSFTEDFDMFNEADISFDITTSRRIWEKMISRGFTENTEFERYINDG